MQPVFQPRQKPAAQNGRQHTAPAAAQNGRGGVSGIVKSQGLRQVVDLAQPRDHAQHSAQDGRSTELIAGGIAHPGGHKAHEGGTHQ